MNIQELRDKRAELKSQAQAIVDAAENGVLTDEQQADFDAKMAEYDRLGATLQRLERMEAINAEAAARPQRKTTPAVADDQTQQTVADSVRVVKERREDDPKLGWNSMAEFAMGVVRACTPGSGFAFDERLKLGAAATGLSQGTGSDGGFLVPPEFSVAVWDGLNAMADNLLGRTDQYTVTGDSLTFNANAETSRATGSRFGGVQGYWIAEAAQMTSSKPKLRQMKLEPQELAVLCYATDKLIRNAGPALGTWLTRAMSEEINFLIGDSIINGDGVGKPTGVVGHAATVSVAKETGQAAATIVKANIDKMWARCHARARAGAVWFINQDIEPQLEALAADVGTGGVPVYLPPGGIADTPNARLKGRPVIPLEYCATLGTVGDIILANLGFYATGLRAGGPQMGSSIHLRFDYNETAFRTIFAVDGQPWLASALTPFKGTNTLSPIVTLATRA